MLIHFSELSQIGYVTGAKVRSTTIHHSKRHGNKLHGEIGNIVEGILEFEQQLGPSLIIKYISNPVNKVPDTMLMLIVRDLPLQRTKKNGLIVTTETSICFLELMSQ